MIRREPLEEGEEEGSDQVISSLTMRLSWDGIVYPTLPMATWLATLQMTCKVPSELCGMIPRETMTTDVYAHVGRQSLARPHHFPPFRSLRDPLSFAI